jgi:hypothetical protein
VVLRRGQSLVHFYFFLILMTFQRLLSTAGFIFMRMIYHSSSVSDLQRSNDGLAADT